jgi:hypothetical protein
VAVSHCLCRVYTDKAGQQHDQHPVYDYYIGAMFMDLGGYAQLKAIAAQRPPTAEEVRQRHGSLLLWLEECVWQPGGFSRACWRLSDMSRVTLVGPAINCQHMQTAGGMQPPGTVLCCWCRLWSTPVLVPQPAPAAGASSTPACLVSGHLHI